MTRRVRVPIANTPQKTVTIDPAATEGAVIGRNVWNEDGSLFKPGTVATPAGDYPVTIWRRVMEVPANVKALASQTGTGLYAITDTGSSATRTIEPTAGETTVSNGSGVAGNPKVGLADVTPTPGGALQKTAFDAKGRRMQEAAATTSDLPEGANRYFTDERAAAAAPLQSIVAGTNVTVDVTDPRNPVVNASGGGGGGAVDSVNGQTGVVVLDAADVGAATTAQGATADTAVQPADLATVATTGAYGDLSGLPTLGTAAAQDSTAFATAAQGALADTALQTAVLSLVAGTNITINATNPEAPVISASGGGGGDANIPAVMARISLGF